MKARFTGKKPSQIVTACFQRGGAGGAEVSEIAAPEASVTGIEPVAGSSNQPSMPVRRFTRSERTNPSPIDNHQDRSGERSQASRASSLAKR